MNSLSRLFHRSCKHEICCLYVSYLINLIIVNIFLMLATGVSNIQNETLSQNDMSQLRTIISSIILVSILTIAFFQWIISMQFQALYNRRNQFNINICLIGINQKKLCELYLQELLFMQITVIPVGIIASEIVYKVIAIILELNEEIIPATQLILASVFHLMVIILSVVVTILKLTRRGIAELLRKTSSMERIPDKKKILLYFIVGTILLCLSFVLENIANMRQLAWASRLIIFLSFFFFCDSIMFIFNKIICHVAEKMKAYHIALAQKITYGYFYRVKIVCMMLIFSITIFLGLQMLYRSVREAGYNVVQNNIKYAGIMVWDEMQYQTEDREDIFFGIRFKSQTSTGTNIFISGINEEYINEYESINLVDINQDGWSELLTDTTSNWIILPEFYITSDDIGNDMKVKIGDVEVTFKILGGYYSNDFSKLNCYVNSTYLRKQLKLSNKYNVAYVKNSVTNYKDLFGENGDYKSKEDISDESVHKAVGGTEVIETIAIIIIICASISLINFLVMTASSNIKDIARFRIIGIQSKDILLIYIIHSLLPIIFAAIWIMPFSTLMCKIACNIMLASEYFSGGYIKVPVLTVTILLLVAFISIMTEVICVQKAVYSKEYISLVKNDN